MQITSLKDCYLHKICNKERWTSKNVSPVIWYFLEKQFVEVIIFYTLLQESFFRSEIFENSEYLNTI